MLSTIRTIYKCTLRRINCQLSFLYQIIFAYPYISYFFECINYYHGQFKACGLFMNTQLFHLQNEHCEVIKDHHSNHKIIDWGFPLKLKALYLRGRKSKFKNRGWNKKSQNITQFWTVWSVKNITFGDIDTNHYRYHDFFLFFV